LDGLTIARQRIRREAEEMTGLLDLGGLALSELPEELFELRHLSRLRLGVGFSDDFRRATRGEPTSIGQNSIRTQIRRVAALTELRSVWLPRTDLASLREIPNLDRLVEIDCSATWVSDLGPLQDSLNLQSLNCSHAQVSDLGPLKDLPNLKSLDCSNTQVTDLRPLKDLQNLQFLDCSFTQVSDLGPLQNLPNLQSLKCSHAQVSDLVQLKNLPSLQSLDCSHTQVSDLAQLKNLPNLQSLECSHTRVSNLGPLEDLPNLQSLRCTTTQVSNLGPLKGLPNLQRLACPNTQVSDLSPLQNLPNLQSLDCAYTQVNDLGPLKDLPNLQSLDCSHTQVSDLAQLKNLLNLQSLECSHTRVSDLGPLKDLPNLQLLFCFHTQVSNLGPLKDLPNLQRLACPDTQVSDLGPLKDLPNLQWLYCPNTQVSDLGPLKDLPNLQWLFCSNTQVRDFGPLHNLSNLRSLNCSYTQVSDLGPLKDLPNLKFLDCSNTQVSDLAPLQNLPSLESVNCRGTQVSDLSPLKDLPHLRSLNFSDCRLTSAPDGFWFKPSMEILVLHQAQVPGIPSEVLSQTGDENCLSSLRAHLRDLDAGAETMSDIKLMVLGNGAIGKTQICRRLRGDDYDERVESTHGILVTSAPLPWSTDGRARLQIWDFGGQDIYHGTHALFMRSRAAFLLVWIPEAENAAEYAHDGITFRNQPLAYWLDYVGYFSGAQSPVLIVQTRCDRPEDEAVRPPLSDTALATFPFRKPIHYSARLDRGRGALDEALADAAAWLRDREGAAKIGAGRWRAKRRLEAMRDADAVCSPPLRRYRTIGKEQFLALCDEEGGINEPGYLLAYLHNSGTVFYRDGLFDDRIILDQGWALEAIYALFHRDKCFKKLRRQKGRFTRSDLGEWLWDAAGHGAAEQELLLSMMESSGICFVHRRAEPDKGIEAEYIAPDLLPEKSDVARELAQRWDANRPVATAEFAYPLLPSGLMRTLISRIGSDAGLDADYWRSGLYVYEIGTGSRAMIEQTLTEGWGGRIRIEAQCGQAVVLLERLTELLRGAEQQMGMTSTVVSLPPPLPPPAEAAPPPLVFGQEPANRLEWCVSYAWGDDTLEGREREAVVDRLCEAADARGITVIRDRTTLGLGERISKFMRRVGRGNRVFVVISEKYLKSAYCMFELSELWRNCREDDEEFLSHIRVYTLPGTKIWTPRDRAMHAVHWKEEYEGLASMVREHGDEILGEKDAHQYRLMKKFARQIGDILATIADVLQPRDFQQLIKYGFSDPPGDACADEALREEPYL
jgi:internalin A